MKMVFIYANGLINKTAYSQEIASAVSNLHLIDAFYN